MKSNKNSLANLTIIYMIGNFGSKVLSFVLVFFMTYYLTREEIGEYDLLLTTSSFIVPFVSMQMDSSLLRWLLDPNFNDKKDLVFNNIFGFLIRNILIYSVLYWGISFFIDWNYKINFYIFSVLMMILPMIQQGTRGIGKNSLYASIGVIYSLFFVFNTLIVLVVFKGGVNDVLLSNNIALFCVEVWIITKNKWWEYFAWKRVDWGIIKSFCRYSLPLLPNTLSWWLIGSSTRYIILVYLGKEFNGLFAISYKYPTIVLVLTNVFTLAWQEQVIKNSNDKEAEKEASSTLDKYISLILSLIIILSICSKVLMSFVDKDYFEAWKYIPILLYAVFLQAIAGFYGAGYLRFRKTKGIFVSSIIGGVCTLLFSFLLVQKFGLYGISFSILVGYLGLLLYRVIHVRKFMLINFPIKKFISMTVLFILVSFMLFYESNWIFPFSLIGSIILLIYINLAEAKSFYKNIILKVKKI